MVQLPAMVQLPEGWSVSVTFTNGEEGLPVAVYAELRDSANGTHIDSIIKDDTATIGWRVPDDGLDARPHPVLLVWMTQMGWL